STPRIAWRLDDLDARTTAGEGGQARFQVQIDTRSTFDAAAGGPLLDSGVVASSTEHYTVPTGRGLAPGTYYVRVRQWDAHDPEPGAWTEPAVRFDVSGGEWIRL